MVEKAYCRFVLINTHPLLIKLWLLVNIYCFLISIKLNNSRLVLYLTRCELFKIFIESRAVIIETFWWVSWRDDWRFIAETVVVLLTAPLKNFPVLQLGLLMLLPVVFNKCNKLFLTDSHKTWNILTDCKELRKFGLLGKAFAKLFFV